MENKPKFHPNPKLKLMEQVREVLRYHHYAYRTEQTYCQWILRFIHFFGSKTHPRNLAVRDVERFLSDLALKQEMSSSTQKTVTVLSKEEVPRFFVIYFFRYLYGWPPCTYGQTSLWPRVTDHRY